MTATRLPAWLGQARRAFRYGLYRVDDPEALTAVMPAAPAPAPAS